MKKIFLSLSVASAIMVGFTGCANSLKNAGDTFYREAKVSNVENYEYYKELAKKWAESENSRISSMIANDDYQKGFDSKKERQKIAKELEIMIDEINANEKRYKGKAYTVRGYGSANIISGHQANRDKSTDATFKASAKLAQSKGYSHFELVYPVVAHGYTSYAKYKDECSTGDGGIFKKEKPNAKCSEIHVRTDVTNGRDIVKGENNTMAFGTVSYEVGEAIIGIGLTNKPGKNTFSVEEVLSN